MYEKHIFLLKMGIIVKLVSGSLGMASEAIHDYRARSHSNSNGPPLHNTQSDSSSRLAHNEAPPEYVEVAGEATADHIVRSDQAERVLQSIGEQQSKVTEVGYDDDYSSDNSSSDLLEVDDEAAWELDDMAERVAPPSCAKSEAATFTTMPIGGEEIHQSEQVQTATIERMVADMVRMAGRPPNPLQRLPCPVIVPQRRPRSKDRGFVRAYAPVLDGCGVDQATFLKFHDDFVTASKVCGIPPCITHPSLVGRRMDCDIDVPAHSQPAMKYPTNFICSVRSLDRYRISRCYSCGLRPRIG